MADWTRKDFLSEGAKKLASPEHEETRRELWVFIDNWGLDFYTPPEHVESRVREIVKGFLYAAERVEADKPT